MNIDHINRATAKDIMTPYVIQATSSATLVDIIKIMSDKQIATIFIEDIFSNKYYLVSHTEIINFLANGGINKKNLPDTSISSIMEGPIEMVDENTPIDLIIHKMQEKNSRRELISRNNIPIGVISQKDILVWNERYFKPAKPEALIIFDAKSSLPLIKHVFNSDKHKELDFNLLDMYGGALSSISHITDELFRQNGKLDEITRNNKAILIESTLNITAILIADHKSINLKHKLFRATKIFEHGFLSIKSRNRPWSKEMFDMAPIIKLFKEDELNPKNKLSHIQKYTKII